jgi:hypothetical protein
LCILSCHKWDKYVVYLSNDHYLKCKHRLIYITVPTHLLIPKWSRIHTFANECTCCGNNCESRSLWCGWYEDEVCCISMHGLSHMLFEYYLWVVKEYQRKSDGFVIRICRLSI